MLYWENPANLSPGTALIDLSGDWAPIRHYGELLDQDPLKVYGDLLDDLRKADYRITNLEAPLSGGKFIVKSGSTFHGEERHIAALRALPFDAVTLGNNHTFDCGVESFSRTASLLRENHIAFTGAGLDRKEAVTPIITTVKGVKLGIFNISEGEDLMAAGPDRAGVSGWEIEETAGMIRQMRNSLDVILVIVHCGLEYVPSPPPYVYKAFEQLVSAGADLVAGHHPHVPQGMSILHGKAVYFSLGNFLFYQPTTLACRKLGYHLHIEINPEGVKSVKVLPYELKEEGLKKYDEENFSALFAELTKAVATEEKMNDSWNGFLKFYHVKGYQAELERILEAIKQDPGKGCAMLRNRVMTLQHNNHWNDGLTRIVDGTIDDASPEALALAEKFFLTEVKK